MSSKTSKKIPLPFSLEELTQKDDWELPIYPDNQHWLAAMRDSENSQGQSAVEKLIQVFVELSPGVWGLKLPRKSVIFVSESQLIKDFAYDRNQAYLEYARIAKKLENELDISPTEVYQILKAPLLHIETLEPWIEEIMPILSSLQATDTTTAQVTVMIQQRILQNWSKDDTPCLPEALFYRLFDYYIGESNGWIEPKSVTDRKQDQGKQPTKAIASQQKSVPAIAASAS